MSKLCTLAAASVFVVGWLLPADTVAKDSERNGTGDSNPFLEEITVTARKREESLLEVPVTVSALTAEAIEARGIRTFSEMVEYTPSISIDSGQNFSNDRGQQNIIIRGMTAQAGSVSEASVFIDGAPIAAGLISSIDDVARVEVLKGPQSAYFGRATFSGAINVVSKDPADEFHARVSGLLGNDRWQEVRAGVEGPLVPGALDGRVSVRYYRMDGQYPDSHSPGARFGDQRSKEASLSLLARPFDGLRAKLFALYSEDKDGPSVSAKFGPAYFNCNAGAAPAGTNNYICGTAPHAGPENIGENTTITPVFQSEVINNSRGILTPLFRNALGLHSGGLALRNFHGSLIVDAELPFASTLSSVSTLNTSRSAGINDYAQEYLPAGQGFLALREILNDDWSQELRINSDPGKRFRFNFGLNYAQSRRQFQVAFSTPFGTLQGTNGSPQDTATKAVFGGASYDFTDRWTLNLEARYQVDNVALLNRSPETTFVEAKFDSFLPRAIVQYKFAPRQQLYASVSKGANPGQFNSQFITTPAPTLAYIQKTYGAGVVVRPETLVNYEVGYKGSLWDGRAQLTAAVYHAIWSDEIVQQSLSVPVTDAQGTPTGGNTLFTIYSNIGRALLNGVEFEANVAPAANWTLDASGSLNANNIRSYSCLVCQPLTGTTNVTGNRLPGYSKWKASAGAEYHRPLGGSGLALFGRGDFNYASGKYDSEANLVTTGALQQVNLRAGVRNETYKVELFVNNLTNNLAYTNLATYPDLANGGTALYAGLPLQRQYGMRAEYRY